MQWVLLRAFEVWAVNKLLRSPAFHQAVRKTNQHYHRIKSGQPMQELGGTNLEKTEPSVFRHFRDEVREQLGMKRATQQQAQGKK